MKIIFNNFSIISTFENLYISILDIDEPSLPRHKRPTVRYEHFGEGSVPYQDETVKGRCRREFFDIIDNTVSAINERFDQDGTRIYSALVSLINGSIIGNNIQPDPLLIANYEELDWEALKAELSIVTQLLKGGPAIKTLAEFAAWLKDSSSRLFLPQVEQLVTLALTLPATNATSERAFSTLKRIKTYLRNTITQKRLNSCFLLNTYKELTSNIDREAVITEFVNNHVDRQRRIATTD